MFSLCIATLQNHPQTSVLKWQVVIFRGFVDWMSSAECFSLEVPHTGLGRWRLGLQSSEDSTGLDVRDGHGWQPMPAVGSPTSWLDWTTLLTGLDYLHWASPCGLGFFQHGSWVSEDSILRMSIPGEPGGSCKVVWPGLGSSECYFHCVLLVKLVTKVSPIRGEGGTNMYREGRPWHSLSLETIQLSNKYIILRATDLKEHFAPSG